MIIFVAISLFVLLSIIWAARGGFVTVRSLDELERRICPLDVPAFRTLNDPEEEKFLVSVLRPADLRAVQRARALATMDYLLRAARNAAILIRLGEAMQKSRTPEVMLSARDLIREAIRLRVYALGLACKVSVRFLFPGMPYQLPGFLPSYESVRSAMRRLVMQAEPARVEAVSKAL